MWIFESFKQSTVKHWFKMLVCWQSIYEKKMRLPFFLLNQRSTVFFLFAATFHHFFLNRLISKKSGPSCQYHQLRHTLTPSWLMSSMQKHLPRSILPLTPTLYTQGLYFQQICSEISRPWKNSVGLLSHCSSSLNVLWKGKTGARFSFWHKIQKYDWSICKFLR